MPDRPLLLLVTGLPGTGKSTFANRIAPTLGAPVLGWDWMMGALTPFEQVQAAIDGMDFLEHRSVGWSLLWQTAGAQLRRGMSVVLDGVARDHEVAGTRVMAEQLGVHALVVMTRCDDLAAHRARIDGRDRGIPGWHELTWKDVQRTRTRWQPPADVDLVLDDVDDIEEVERQVERTMALVASLRR